MRRSPATGATAGALALLLCACGLAEAPAGPVIGKPAPAYTAATLQGDSVSLSSLEGRVVLLNLWATWCAPCRKETPFLQDLYEARRAQGLEIVGISLDTRGQEEFIEQFVQEYGVEYTVLHDPLMTGMETYQVLGLPATFLIDRDGTLRWMRYGPLNENDRDFLDALGEALQ